MGKGYNNFMSKKPFHPGSRDNLKRVWMAQQKTEDYNKKEEEMRIQYEKEQDLYNNRLLVSTESKDKLSLNFMYEAPVGATKERVKEDDEPEYKFEWQRHAPRESYAKGNMDIRDQPFGIQVRNVRCLKCHKWGHVNTDRECELYSQSSSLLPGTSKANPEELLKAMKEDGLALKKSLIGQAFDSSQANQVMVPEKEEDPEMAYLRTLTKKQKEEAAEEA
ncbi:Corepressor interacting with RBPJ 1 [Halotydeus destructor]|nr:Corepressor interacting with RBPJ 1 [Halotydeus destructor]